jgi:Ca2+-binding RTX toxin-like protein
LGGVGDDVLRGGAGIDLLDGGVGFDRASFFSRAATQGVVVSLLTQIVTNDGYGNAETLVSIEGLGGGTAFADNFTGDNSRNLIIVGLGDTAHGLAGDDVFQVEGAGALIDGGDGIDTLESFDDRLLLPDANADGLAEVQTTLSGVIVDLATNSIVDDGFGNSGALLSIENVGGSRFADQLSGDAGANTLQGFEGGDTLLGGAGNDVLDGGAGRDTLDGGAGDDILIGGTGADTYIVDSVGDQIIEISALGSGDLVQSSVSWSLGANLEDLTLTGLNAINGTGNTLDNTITGNDANNIIDGGLGDDRIDGGLGADTASYASALAAVLVDLSIVGPQSTIAAGTDTLTNIENVTGSAFNDDLRGDAGANVLDGGAGRDRLEGGAGDDTYILDNGFDVVVEAPLGGIDTVIAPFKVSLQTFANVENATVTGTGNFALTGNSSANILTGNSGANVMDGKGGDDLLIGGAGFDVLTGGAGADTLIGGTGNDNYSVDSVGDIVTEALNEGVDLVRTSVSYALTAHVENLVLVANAGAINGTGNDLANIVTGNGFANTLSGLEGNDNLSGVGGNDVLIGGLGNDRMSGGAGQDAFVFNAALGAANVDTITDFSVVDDTIHLDDAVFTALAPGALAAGAFHVVAGGSAAGDADDRIIYNATNGALWYDADGTGAGAAVFFAQVSAGLALTSADFLVI